MKIFSQTFAQQALHKLDAALLHHNGRVKLLPAAYYHEHFTQDEISAWCIQRARYGIPTLELINWLKAQIGERKAIEIGAGQGDLCYHLGIRGIDSYFQTTQPGVQAWYQQTTQTPTTPPKTIEKRSALAAVRKYRPAVVVASWITQLYQPGDEQGSVYGVDEQTMLPHIETYLHVGNTHVHGQKRILQLPHQVFQPPWLVSRAEHPQDNLIYIWNNQP